MNKINYIVNAIKKLGARNVDVRYTLDYNGLIKDSSDEVKKIILHIVGIFDGEEKDCIKAELYYVPNESKELKEQYNIVDAIGKNYDLYNSGIIELFDVGSENEALIFKEALKRGGICYINYLYLDKNLGFSSEDLHYISYFLERVIYSNFNEAIGIVLLNPNNECDYVKAMYCHMGFSEIPTRNIWLKMNFVTCQNIVRQVMEEDKVQVDKNGDILVYRLATDSKPEGYYPENVHQFVCELFEDKYGQLVVLNALFALPEKEDV